MQLDIDRYRSFVDRYDWPEEQKIAALTQLWSIMSSFVDRAFGDAPEQQLKLGGTSNQRGTSAAKQLETVASESSSALDCEKPLTPTFNDAADQSPAGKSSP